MYIRKKNLEDFNQFHGASQIHGNKYCITDRQTHKMDSWTIPLQKK